MTDIFRPGDVEPERRFTEPTAECPHPEWWHSTDADSTEVEVTALIAAMVRALQPELVVETGAAWGQTTQAIGAALVANGHGVLHSIEPDAERADYTRRRCEGLPVVVEQLKSLHWRPPAPVDFAFFDSLIYLRVAEFQLYYPQMHNGTFVAFHDTADRFNLWPEIEQLEADQKLMALRFPTPRGLVVAEVVS